MLPCFGKEGNCCLLTATTVLAAIFALCWAYCGCKSKNKKISAKTRELLTTKIAVEKDFIPISTELTADADISTEAKCAQRMREVVKTHALSYPSLAKDPMSLLGASRPSVRPDYGALLTRFTVQYNLFAGSIVALGNDAQRQQLYDTQDGGELGCFAFTEIGAGVMSGAGAEAEAVYNKDTQTFTINSPTNSSRKTWISQGMYAEWAVIMANLLIPQSNGEMKNHGPHLFFTRIQHLNVKTDVLTAVKGVVLESLAKKSTMPGLDNAYVRFESFEVKRIELLSRFSNVEANGEYTLNLPTGVKRMLDLLITRLLTGRVCLSDFSIAYSQNLFRQSFTYATERELWRGKKAKGEYMIEKPLIKNMFVNYAHSLHIISHYVGTVRTEVADCIRASRFPPSVVDSVGICKFVGTSFAVDSISVLRKTMGAQALFESSGLGSGSLVCNATCAAEGDNTIMELKLVGDLFKGGFARLFPVNLLFKCMFASSIGRRAVCVYVYKVLYAFYLQKKALDEGQLLRDIAWARAHLHILSAWYSDPTNDASWAESYNEILMRFPTPSQF